MLKTKFLLLAIVITALACQSKKDKLTESIIKLETSDSSSTPKGFNQLADLYFDYAKSFPEDTVSENYLYKGFMFKYLTNHWDDAIKFATYYKTKYPVSENYHRINLKLADVYLTGKNNSDSAVRYFLLADGKVQFSTDEYRKAGNTIAQRVKSNPGSNKNPGLLFTAAKFLQLCTDFEKAVEIYSEVAKTYPAYEKSPDALMAAGFISWNNLQKPEDAKTFYHLLSQKYPGHPLAKEAKMILSENILTMTELELAEYLTKKNQEKNQGQ